MFIHNFKYSFKTLFRNKMLIFWTFAFPIILGTFFNMAFSNIENSEKLEVFDIAIVDNEQFQTNKYYNEAFKILSDDKNENKLFNINYVIEDEAKKLLNDDEIIGYMILEEDSPKVVVKKSGINETVLKHVTEEITQTSKIVDNISKEKIQDEILKGNYNINFEKIYEEVAKLASNNSANIEDISSKNLSYTMIEFYTLIAMTCLYGGILGMVAINQNLPNMSNIGKRVAISPTPKLKIVFSTLFAGYITQLMGITLLFLYTIFVLKVDYGSNILLVILLAIIGSFAGLAMGLAIGTVLKANEGIKTGIMITITMFGCFLSGMMGITMKYIVDKNIPILNKINPASMITDGLYSLYYYDTLDRFYFNIISLIIFSAIMIIISYTCLRRQKYDSI